LYRKDGSLINIANLTLFPYQLNGRKGVICQLVNRDGETYFGDASPLPNWSKESFPEVLDQLKEVQRCVYEKKIIRLDELYPSVHFAVTEPISSKPLLKPQKVRALLAGTYDEIIEKAAKSRKKGYETAKVKIKDLSTLEIIDLITTLSQDFELHIDTNRSFSLFEASTLFLSLKSYYSFIEEPTFEDPESLAFPFALDESLHTLKSLPKNPNLRAITIKPTLMGGPSRYLALIEAAKASSCGVFFSCCFESPIGILQLMRLQQRYSSDNIPSGLSLEETSLLEDPIVQNQGKFYPPGHVVLNRSFLRECCLSHLS
jgi:o-succinylbenzoate synthase